MPLLRCANPECGHQWFESSRLAEDSDCIECGEPAMVVDADDDLDIQELNTRGRVPDDRPKVAYAREAARALLEKYGVESVPVPVRRLASLEGLEIREVDLSVGLRGRLVGNTLEIASGDPEVVKRFSIAHELGHHRMQTVHSQGRRVETDANAFAGELLVPGPRLLEALRSTTDTRELARMFQVSKKAIQIAAQQHRKGAELT